MTRQAGWSGKLVGEQADMWGGRQRVIARIPSPQLAMFSGQGPGGSAALPTGAPIAADYGMMQGTLALVQATQDYGPVPVGPIPAPADNWPDPDELADCEGCTPIPQGWDLAETSTDALYALTIIGQTPR